jgi:hypothetical protein
MESVVAVTGAAKFSVEAVREVAGTSSLISDNTVADAVEALVGAALLAGGVPSALEMARFFGLPIDVSSWVDYVPLLSNVGTAVPDHSTSDSDTKFDIDKLEEIIQYRFQDRNLARQAFTHKSCGKSGMSYERLEYLGDAVLDFLVIRFLFGINNPSACDSFPKFIPNLNSLPHSIREQLAESEQPLDPGRLLPLNLI